MTRTSICMNIDSDNDYESDSESKALRDGSSLGILGIRIKFESESNAVEY